MRERMSHRQEFFRTEAPGRYAVFRAFDLGGQRFERIIECASPVWAYRQLNDWEETVLTRAVNQKKS